MRKDQGTRCLRWRRCAAIILALTVLGCDGTGEDGASLAPDSCELEEATTGPLRVIATIDSRFPTVPVRILLGDWEDGSFVLEDQVTTAIMTYELHTNVNYTALATYVIGPDTVLVIDSDKITTSSTEFDDATCWSLNGAEVDVRLRITP